MRATQRVLAPRGQSDRLFGCYPVGCEQILLPRGSQGRRIRSDRPGIRGMSDKGVTVMDHDLKTKILDILDRNRLMVVATNRPDGWPQATTVGYVNIGLTLYFWCRPRSQKASNLTRDSRISLAIGDEGSDPMTIAGLSMAAEAKLENGPAEISKATSLLYLKYPANGPFRAFEHNETLIYRVTPKVISVIDYIKGFGHTELIIVDAGD